MYNFGVVMTEEEKKLLSTFETQLRHLMYLHDELKRENAGLRKLLENEKLSKSAAMILFIIAASTAFSWVFTFSGASAALVQLVVSMNLNKTLFCLVVAIILLIFGTFMEGTAIAVLLVPVLWPIAESMGINVIHFGMILCISNVIGTMTPPVAVNIFSAVQVTRSVRELKIGEISKAEIPFFIGYVAVFFLCVFSETFCTFLIR